jgi:hypothetical protein
MRLPSLVVSLLFSLSGIAPSQGRPQLSRVALPGLDSIGPETKAAEVAITADGVIAFTGGFDARKRAVTVVDSRGKVLGRFGAPGRGPGEVNQPLQLAFGEREVFILEVAARRASRFSLAGEFLGMVPTPSSFYLLGMSGDSADMLDWPTGPMPISDYRRVATSTLTGRLITGSKSPVVREMATRAKGPADPVATILYASLGTNVVVANPNAYEIQVLDPAGTVLYAVAKPTQAGVTKFKEMGGLHADSRGRLWVIRDSGADATVADVYAGKDLVGTIDIGCRGNVSIKGDWVAVLCTKTSNPNKDVELRVFRITQ